MEGTSIVLVIPINAFYNARGNFLNFKKKRKKTTMEVNVKNIFVNVKKTENNYPQDGFQMINVD
jgi:hypothetical protein